MKEALDTCLPKHKMSEWEACYKTSSDDCVSECMSKTLVEGAAPRKSIEEGNQLYNLISKGAFKPIVVNEK